jgi:deoxyribonuclease V
MEVARPTYVPDPGVTAEEMQALQAEIAAEATFDDEHGIDPAVIEPSEPFDLNTALSPPDLPGETPWADSAAGADSPVVVGIDQAFLDDVAVSAAVAIQGDRVIEVACGRTPLEIPYIPGLLAFREGGPIIAALQALSVEPDLLVLDGNGRIHFRQAGIATHVGLVFDVPAVGVAKNLLCGTPERSLDDPLPAGTRVEIAADESVDADPGTPLGYAFQSRQYPNPERRHVNPIYVSPGHRVGVAGSVDLVDALCAGYKLPEPIRLADRAATACKD